MVTVAFVELQNENSVSYKSLFLSHSYELKIISLFPVFIWQGMLII